MIDEVVVVVVAAAAADNYNKVVQSNDRGHGILALGTIKRHTHANPLPTTSLQEELIIRPMKPSSIASKQTAFFLVVN
jgi:hypothetical protein